MTTEEAAGWITWRQRPGQEPKPLVNKRAPAGTLEVVKENQLAALAAARDRYWKVPPEGAIEPDGLVKGLPEGRRRRLLEYVVSQGDGVKDWVNAQAEQYWREGMDARDCLVSAARDLLEWQKAWQADPLAELERLGDVR